MKPYVLHTAKKRKNRRTVRLESNSSINARLHPAEEALLDFRPDSNEIDEKLFSGIVAYRDRYSLQTPLEESLEGHNVEIRVEEVNDQLAKSRFADLKSSKKQSSSSGSSDSSSDGDYGIGG